ncbi:50S ribosomal protein L6 [Patescibacteria group bacterium]|nr:50S ribosomal protein L6 [Patescibacteria group bacterium]
MSRIGKQPITIPDKTEVSISDGILSVKGPLGELTRKVRNDVKIEVVGQEVVVTLVKKTRLARALWGTYASHIDNMVHGVNELFEKKLVVEGVGYRVELSGGELTLNMGYSHPVKLTVPEGIEVQVLKNTINIKGSDKEVVGQFAAEVRSVRKPEPYKGKGIRYHDEVIRRKQGKKAV